MWLSFSCRTLNSIVPFHMFLTLSTLENNKCPKLPPVFSNCQFLRYIMLVLNWNDVANRHVRIELFARRRQRNPDEPSQPGMIGLILCYIPIHFFLVHQLIVCGIRFFRSNHTQKLPPFASKVKTRLFFDSLFAFENTVIAGIKHRITGIDQHWNTPPGLYIRPRGSPSHCIFHMKCVFWCCT